ncbi:MAG: type II secretion system protein [Limnobacter sp.]
MLDSPKHSNARHAGFLSIELALVLIISAVIAFAVVQQQARSAKSSVAKIQADQLNQVGDALNSYTDLYRRGISAPGDLQIDLNNDGITDVTIPENPVSGNEGSKLTPTIENLIDIGLLPSSLVNSPAASNGQFITRLSILPAGCSIAADNCRIEGYITLSQPVTIGGQNSAAGEFDNDIAGDMLGFMGGNGFVTLQANTPATSAGGNFTVSLDLDGNNSSDANTPAGIPGVRVGALASRYDVRNPIPDVDFCRGNRTLNWVQNSNSCSTVIFNDTPVGYRFVAVDADAGGGAGAGGSAFIRCVYNPNANPPAQLSILSSCCQNGNQACTPPAVP